MCHLYRRPQPTSVEEIAQVERLGERGTARVEGGNLVEGELEIATMEREQVGGTPVINELERELERTEYRRVRVQAMFISRIQRIRRQIDTKRAETERLEIELELMTIRHQEQSNRRRRNFTMFLFSFYALVITYVVFRGLQPSVSCNGDL